jgi:hypothetical protein
MFSQYFILLITVVVLMTSASDSYTPVSSVKTSNPWHVDVILRSSIYLPTPRPISDVFFQLNNSTPDMVYRIERQQTEEQTNLALTAYATVNATPHDTYKLTSHPFGPFPKGADLGFTLKQWLAAIGTGTYVEQNANATIDLTFRNLVPNGTYSVWSHRVTMPPNYRYTFSPLGAPDGSQNSFHADASGNATFSLDFAALPASTNLTFPDYVAMYVTKTAPVEGDINWTLIAVIYHSDGQIHGSVPGDLGKDAHVQLVHLMYPRPARTYEEWKNATVAVAAAPAETKMPAFEGILALAGLLVAALVMTGRRP